MESEHLIGVKAEFLKGKFNSVVAIGDEGNLKFNGRDEENQRPSSPRVRVRVSGETRIERLVKFHGHLHCPCAS